MAASRIARWDETHGTSLGAGLTSNGWADALALAPDGDLYAGGSFSSIGAVSANNLARWDGTNWWDVGGQGCRFISIHHYHNRSSASGPGESATFVP